MVLSGGASAKICAICGRIYNKKVLCIPRIPWENILQEEYNPWEAFHCKKK